MAGCLSGATGNPDGGFHYGAGMKPYEIRCTISPTQGWVDQQQLKLMWFALSDPTVPVLSIAGVSVMDIPFSVYRTHTALRSDGLVNSVMILNLRVGLTNDDFIVKIV
jgi:hypothetical protein